MLRLNETTDLSKFILYERSYTLLYSFININSQVSDPGPKGPRVYVCISVTLFAYSVSLEFNVDTISFFSLT